MKKTPLTTAQAASLFQHVLRQAGHDLPVSASDFKVSEECVIVGAMSGEKLAEALFDRLFPRSPSGQYHHFTTYGGFKGIVSSGKLRLYNLHKRFHSGEFRTFCSDHHMTGYLREGADGKLEGHYASLMDDLFYTSLVGENCPESERLWEVFGDGHKGVRLTFQVRARQYPYFRAVSYQDPNRLPLLADLQAAFMQLGRQFISLGLSRMGGFYQRRDYSYQGEHRLLAKRLPDCPFQFDIKSKGKGRVKFIECDLLKPCCSAFSLELRGVVAGTDCELTKVQTYLQKNSVFPNIVAEKEATTHD